MSRFLRFVRETRGVPLEDGDYAALRRWSVAELSAFWACVAEFFAVDFRRPPSEVLGRAAMPGAEWFPGAELSYVDRVFRERPAADTAIVARREGVDGSRELSWDELRATTARLAAGLRAAGVGPGDRVVGYLPNVPETVCAFLAAAAVGAIWSCCSPDFGPEAVTDRFSQIEPKVLFAADGYRYAGRRFDRLDALAALQRSLPSLELTIVLPLLAEEPDLSGLRAARTWEDFHAEQDPDAALTPTAVPFSHPLWILYSSGTTGMPKAIVHSHGGILLEHLKWVGLQTDIGPADRLFWLTTTGWTMWNFLVGALLMGAVPVLYDGSPGHPDAAALWDLAEETGVTCFGAGASFYAAAMKAGVVPRAGRALERLRAIGSTGSPLSPEGFDWLYAELGPDLWLFSTSGGTDVCTAFVGGTPLLPVRRGEIQAPALGVDVQAWDARGRRLQGEVGELVVTQPMPSMPVAFWGDADGSRLHDAYFSVYPGVWRHGDWIEMTASGGAIIHGRSDSTINRGGVRIGTAEIYRAVLGLAEVDDALVVDVPRSGEESWMPLFVALAGGRSLDDELRTTIAARIRAACSPRHVPSAILEAPAIPRTLSGKVLEIPVKRMLMGEPADAVASRDALADPAALDWFAEFSREAVAGRTGR